MSSTVAEPPEKTNADVMVTTVSLKQALPNVEAATAACPALPLEIIGIILCFLALFSPSTARTAAQVHPSIAPKAPKGFKLWSTNTDLIRITTDNVCNNYVEEARKTPRNFPNVRTLRIGLPSDQAKCYASYASLLELRRRKCWRRIEELQLVSAKVLNIANSLGNIKELTLLDGQSGGGALYRRVRNLRELSLLNAGAKSIKYMLRYVRHIHSIFFFVNHDRPIQRLRLQQNILDPSIKIPAWLERGLYPIHHSMKRLYFVLNKPDESMTAKEDCYVEKRYAQQVVNKWNAWRMMAYHYTLHCPSGMR